MFKKLAVMFGLSVLLAGSLALAAGNRQPLDGNGRIMDKAWYGATCQIVTSTTPALISASPVFVDFIMVTSGTASASAYAVLVDSNTASGVTTALTSRFLIAPAFTASSTGTATGIHFEVPILSTYGLVIANQDADIVTSVCWRAKP